ncbi:MAG: hypothetical protein LBQ36_05215, partial [Synergistaceae bacterium]|nr:hypothetical protein [Synergistaceae bacterium]
MRGRQKAGSANSPAKTAPLGRKIAIRNARPPGIRARWEQERNGWWAGFIGRFEASAQQKHIVSAKNYAKSGRVIELNVTAGLIEARVQGRRKAPYSVKLRSPLPDERKLEEVKRRLCEKAICKAMLLSGEAPPELGDIFRSSGVLLSLDGFSGSQMLCGCSESDAVCKHILAVVYVASVAFDRDPFLLLKFRGFEKEELIEVFCAPLAHPGARLSDADIPSGPMGCGGETGDASAGHPPAPSAAFYGSPELPKELNRLASRPPMAASPMPRSDFPLWKGDVPFDESVAPYFKSA